MLLVANSCHKKSDISARSFVFLSLNSSSYRMVAIIALHGKMNMGYIILSVVLLFAGALSTSNDDLQPLLQAVDAAARHYCCAKVHGQMAIAKITIMATSSSSGIHIY